MADHSQSEDTEAEAPEDLDERLEELRSARKESRQQVEKAREALQKIAREV